VSHVSTFSTAIAIGFGRWRFCFARHGNAELRSAGQPGGGCPPNNSTNLNQTNNLHRRKELMKVNSISRIVLAVVLSISFMATRCSARWIIVALADQVVLTQVAFEHGGAGSQAANRQTAQYRRSACHPEHFGGSEQRPAASAVAIQAVPSQPELGPSSRFTVCSSQLRLTRQSCRGRSAFTFCASARRPW